MFYVTCFHYLFYFTFIFNFNAILYNLRTAADYSRRDVDFLIKKTSMMEQVRYSVSINSNSSYFTFKEGRIQTDLRIGCGTFIDSGESS